MTRSYIIEESDLNEYWHDWLGRFIPPSKIGVPLCTQCDSVMQGDVCPSCATDALLDLTVEQLGGGYHRVAA